MKRILLFTFALTVCLASVPVWALFESNKTLSEHAKIPMDQAVKSALGKVPGKAVEAKMGKDEGRYVYEIEILDANNKKHKVYVDASDGKIVETK